MSPTPTKPTTSPSGIVNPYEALSKQNVTYGFRGGTAGGDIWDWKEPTEMQKLAGYTEKIPVLKEQFKEKKDSLGRKNPNAVRVLPTGAGSRQEMRYLKESAEAEGVRWTEAPVRYKRGGGTSQRDRADMFYDPQGRPIGSIGFFSPGYSGMGKGRPNTTQRSWSNYVGDNPIESRKGTNFYGGSQSWGPEGSGIPLTMGGPRGFGSKQEATNIASWEKSPRWSSGQGPTQLASVEEKQAWEARAPIRQQAFQQSPMGQRMNQPTASPTRLGLGNVGFGGVPRFPMAGKY